MSKRFGRNKRRRLEQKHARDMGSLLSTLRSADREIQWQHHQIRELEVSVAKWRPRGEVERDGGKGWHHLTVKVADHVIQHTYDPEALVDSILAEVRYDLLRALDKGDFGAGSVSQMYVNNFRRKPW